MREFLNPPSAELRRIGGLEDEAERDRWVKPQRRSTGGRSLRVAPRQRKALVSTELGGDDYFEVRERPVVNLNRRMGVAVIETAHQQLEELNVKAEGERTMVFLDACSRDREIGPVT